MATEFTQDAVLQFLIARGGRVKNRELIDHFRSRFSSASFRETLKRFVDALAVVRLEDGDKFVCVRRRFRGPVMLLRTDGPFNLNMAVGSGEDAALGEEGDAGGKLSAVTSSDDAMIEGRTKDTDSSPAQPSQPAQLTNPGPAEPAELRRGEDASPAGEDSTCPNQDLDVVVKGEDPEHASQIASRRRPSKGPGRGLLALSEGGEKDGVQDSGNVAGEGNTPKGSRKSFLEAMMSSSPQVRTLVHRTSQGNMAPRGKEGEPAACRDEDCASVMLDPLEHEWMLCASDGEWESLRRLLAREPSLVTKRDFVTGFTCLHWAAKQGKQELFATLVGFAKEHGVPLNVNARSGAGYTPLHLAAMHNHAEVVKLLVGAFEADVELRDHSGRKASQYLSPTAAGDIKDIIGACGDADAEGAESAGGRWRLPRVLHANLNPLRLLSAPDDGECDAGGGPRPRSLYRKSSIGRIKLNRGRFKTQIVHSTSFRESEEGDESLKSPVKSRPMSNLFG
ncbi:ankyrin repeat domain-containing protein SOWAHC [Denticeps clupeoides]|uniref:ankyrin repeat domain-containing protein SOWAHC n=1 Tax=Denticeps clupeoides TaxID=299321 RepID=UPI0010A2EC18|nr:ankyrin repeat domain-containing protein SOWAHC [Denticeps clupeoides]